VRYLYNGVEIRPLFGNEIPWEKDDEDYIESIRKEAYLEGLKEGQRNGRIEAEKKAKEEIEKIKKTYEKKEKILKEERDILKKAKEEIEKNLVSMIKKAVEEIISLREGIIKRAEEDILKISFLIAKKVIKKEVSEYTKEIIIGNIKEAINNAIEKDKVIIRVHPEDYESLLKIEELKEILNIENLVIKKDQSIKMRGGCIVETEYSKLDATIENQLSLIEDLLRGERC